LAQASGLRRTFQFLFHRVILSMKLMVALVLWTCGDSMRVRQESAVFENLKKLAKQTEAETDTLVDNDEAVSEDAVATEQMTIVDEDKAYEDSKVGAQDGEESHHGEKSHDVEESQDGENSPDDEDTQDDVFQQSALEVSKRSPRRRRSDPRRRNKDGRRRDNRRGPNRRRDDRRRGGRRRDDRRRDDRRRGSSASAKIPIQDINPIGLGTINGAHGLFVKIFGSSGSLALSDLRQLALERKFPDGFRYGVRTGAHLEHRDRRRSSLRRGPVSRSQNAGKKPFQSQKSEFVEANFDNIFLIICPFLSTMMNEGGLKLKQEHSLKELLDVTLNAGLNFDDTKDHVDDNFANNPDSVQDIWNMEGVMNEHKSSTGINDCGTSFRNCRGSPGHRVCDASTTRSLCSLPSLVKFDLFIKAVDSNRDNRITQTELDSAVNAVS